MQNGKMVVWGGLTNSWEKKRSERQRRKGKIHPSECRVPKNSKGDKKAFLSDKCREIEENSRMGKNVQNNHTTALISCASDVNAQNPSG